MKEAALRCGVERAQRANSETGTGFACGAKLSEALPPVANAPVVRVTQKSDVAGGATM
jgi:hypothetical protein